MTQFGCRVCGHHISDITDRLPYKGYLVPDEDMFLVQDGEDPFARTMYECENCGRLWIQAAPDKNKWVSYLPESAARGILRHEGVDTDD